MRATRADEEADQPATDERRGVAARAIDRLKRKLLDLSLRNRLLNFRHSPTARNHVRLIDEVPEVLFDKLTEGSSLEFRAVDLPEQEPEDERQPPFLREVDEARRTDQDYIAAKTALGARPRKARVRQIERELKNRVRARLGLQSWESPASPEDQARAMGVDPAYDLPHPSEVPERHHTDDYVQTLLFPHVMDAKLNAIRDAARTLAEDAGVMALYCAFAFLEWYESPDSSVPHHAPLVLCPVTIERQLDGGVYVFTLRGRDDDVETNIALAELLRESFGIELPGWSDESTLASYCDAVAHAVGQRDARWTIRRWVTVGLFTFDRLVMFRDLNTSGWSPGEGPEDHAILKHIFAGGDRVESASYAADYDVDEPQARKLLPYLVADADTSQHSAVVDAMSGRSLVIQGPPGTGKSQTITNIISTALGEGKSVLFVAEKMAALEVVHKRLEAAGLGDFCLELHSHKTRKTEVLASLKQRLEKHPPAADRLDLDGVLAAREKARESLSHYVKRMNELAGETGLTVHDLLWGSKTREAALKRLPKTVASVRVADALRLTPHQRADIVEAARALEDEQRRLTKWGRWSEQPWRGVQNRDLTRPQRDAAIAAAASWRTSLKNAHGVAERIATVSGSPPPSSAAELASFAAAAAGVPDPADDVVVALLPACGDPSVRGSLRQLADAQTAQAKLGGEIARVANPDAVLSASDAVLSRLSEIIRVYGYGSARLRDVQQAVRDRKQQVEDLERCVELTQSLNNLVGTKLTPHATRALVLCIDATRHLQRAHLWLRQAAVVQEAHTAIISAAASRATALLVEEKELNASFRLDAAPAPPLLREAERSLRGASWWSRIFGTEHRRAVRLHRSLSRATKRPHGAMIADDLERIAAHLERRAAFDADATVASACGDRFAGVRTDFASLQSVAEWATAIRASTPLVDRMNQEIRDLFLAGTVENLDRFLGCSEHPAFDRLVRYERELTSSIEEHASSVRRSTQQLGALAQELVKLGLHEDAPLQAVNAIAAGAKEFRALQQTIASLVTAHQAMRDAGCKATPREIKATTEFADGLIATSPSSSVATWLLRDAQRGSFEHLRSLQNEAGKAARGVASTAQAVTNLLALDPEEWCGTHAMEQTSTAALLERIDRALAAPDALDATISFLRVEDAAKESGLNEIARAFRQADADYAEVSVAFGACFYQSAADEILREDPHLRQHSGQSHEAVRRRFQELDCEVAKMGRQLLVGRLMAKHVPEGNGKGARGTWTERSLILHQASLQRRHVALRALLDRAGLAIRALKPCFMMSPMSVAQYLAPGQPKFDLVVMDEASQMRPEDALGAIVRIPAQADH